MARHALKALREQRLSSSTGLLTIVDTLDALRQQRAALLAEYLPRAVQLPVRFGTLTPVELLAHASLADVRLLWQVRLRSDCDLLAICLRSACDLIAIWLRSDCDLVAIWLRPDCDLVAI